MAPRFVGIIAAVGSGLVAAIVGCAFRDARPVSTSTRPVSGAPVAASLPSAAATAPSASAAKALLHSYVAEHGNVFAAAFLPDGRRALTGGGGWDRSRQAPVDCDITLSYIADGLVQRRFIGHTAWVKAIVVLPGGQRFASAGLDGTIRIWDVDSGNLIRMMTHAHEVNALAASADGKYLFAGLGFQRVTKDRLEPEPVVAMWEVETGRNLDRFEGDFVVNGFRRELRPIADYGGAGNDIHAVASSRDGRYLASGGYYPNAIRLWEVEGGREVRRFFGHTEGIYALTFSDDGKRLYSGNADRTLRVWDVETGAEVQCWEHVGWVHAMALSRDGRRLLTAGGHEDFGLRKNYERHPFDCYVRLLDAQTGRETARCVGDPDFLWALGFSPDETMAISGGYDKSWRVWNLQSDEARSAPRPASPRMETCRFEGHRNRVYTAQFSADGETVLSAGDDHRVRIWSVADAREISGADTAPPEREWMPARTILSPDGAHVLYGANTVTLKRLSDGEAEHVFQRPVGIKSGGFDMRFLPDGRSALCGSAAPEVYLVDLATGQVRMTYTVPRKMFGGQIAPAVSQDGTRMAAFGEADQLFVFDVVRGGEIGRVSLPRGLSMCAAFCPDGRIATGGIRGDLNLWDVAAKRVVRHYAGTLATVWCVDVSPDGHRIASGGMDGLVHVYDVEKETALKRFSGHRQMVQSVRFSPDGKRLVSASQDGTVRVWALGEAAR